ncbi:phospholipase A1 [Polaromonas sp. OV174]|uniref:phospholipase A n=1 Tax=Polaromonas sp. OV174 TaxID=1855300 RepID=UPI0008ED23A6|nr:phospholipase A [Polaromonas sp. OV174]SFC68340.1 phospholipase A1 [Polaromonas sp. OV174]
MAPTLPSLAQRLPLAAGLLLAGLAQAQSPPAAAPPANKDWQLCQTLRHDPGLQLACFQQWAESQLHDQLPPPSVTPVPANPATGQPATQLLLLPTLNTESPDGKPIGCKNDQYSELSKFWELQRGTDCDNFGLRGYRPISLAVIASDSVNLQPSSPAVGHTAAAPLAYKRSENKIQLSIRTKLAKGLLKDGANDDDDHDSLWFGYTQQSYWQLFNAGLSRPFRTTDHEPELIYIYPHQIPLAGGWNYRLSGLGLVHQSNGQSLPLSRSWNRVYLMGAAEKTLSQDSSLRLQGRVWHRLREKIAEDDNPGIQNYVGRAELSGSWQISKAHTVGITVRHSLRSEARGSTRLDWMMAPTSSPNYTGLRYHIQLFSGYGDSLVDYNRKRTVLSLGLSLVDW